MCNFIILFSVFCFTFFALRHYCYKDGLSMLTNAGAIKRTFTHNNLLCIDEVSSFVMINTCGYENRFRICTYSDGIGISRKRSQDEYFLPIGLIEITGDHCYPLQFKGAKTLKLQLGDGAPIELIFKLKTQQ